MTGNSRVFDSWALLAFAQDEPSALKVQELLTEAIRTGAPALVTTVNLAEVWYPLARSRGDRKADQIVSQVLSLQLSVVPVDWELAQQAARFKARHKIALGDCFAAALAKLRDIEVVTGDPEFKQLTREIKVLWV